MLAGKLKKLNEKEPGSNPTVQKIKKKIGATKNTKETDEIRKLTSALEQKVIEIQTSKTGSVGNMAEEESIELSLLRQKLPTTFAQYRFITIDLKIDLPKWEKMNKRPKWATENIY